MKRYPLQFLSVLLLISALLFTLDQTSIFEVVAGTINASLVRPILGTSKNTLGDGAYFFSSLLSFRSALDEISHTEEERDFYRGEYFKLKAVEEENVLLRQALQIESGKQQLVLAHVVSLDTLQPTQELIVDKGSNEGIKVGQAVITDGRTLVGIIRDTASHQSTVLLTTAEQSRIPALLASSGTNASIKGSATGVLQLDLVPRETPLTEGELVLTSGIAGDIPPQLLMGQVRRIIDDEAASFKRATVEPFVEAHSLRQVFIVVSQ